MSNFLHRLKSAIDSSKPIRDVRQQEQLAYEQKTIEENNRRIARAKLEFPKIKQSFQQQLEEAIVENARKGNYYLKIKCRDLCKDDSGYITDILVLCYENIPEFRQINIKIVPGLTGQTYDFDEMFRHFIVLPAIHAVQSNIVVIKESKVIEEIENSSGWTIGTKVYAALEILIKT